MFDMHSAGNGKYRHNMLQFWCCILTSEIFFPWFQFRSTVLLQFWMRISILFLLFNTGNFTVPYVTVELSLFQHPIICFPSLPICFSTLLLAPEESCSSINCDEKIYFIILTFGGLFHGYKHYLEFWTQHECLLAFLYFMLRLLLTSLGISAMGNVDNLLFLTYTSRLVHFIKSTNCLVNLELFKKCVDYLIKSLNNPKVC